MKESLGGILEGIRHLHSLGLVHNDITPSNIMLDDDGTLVLINFYSCRKVGELLRETKTKRTHGWHDPDVKTASEKNDLDAFSELQTWLFRSSVDEFQFKWFDQVVRITHLLLCINPLSSQYRPSITSLSH